jgi:hypothetical protein
MAPQQRKSRSIGGTDFQRVNAAAAGRRWIVLLLLVVALLALDVQLQCVQGANYTVGDQFGWSLPEANGFNSSYYNDEWLTTLVLYPGDILCEISIIYIPAPTSSPTLSLSLSLSLISQFDDLVLLFLYACCPELS